MKDPTAVQAPVWRPFALSKERVTGYFGLLDLMQCAKDPAQQTNRVLPLMVDKKVHYRVRKLFYGAEKPTRDHACLPAPRT